MIVLLLEIQAQNKDYRGIKLTEPVASGYFNEVSARSLQLEFRGCVPHLSWDCFPLILFLHC